MKPRHPEKVKNIESPLKKKNQSGLDLRLLIVKYFFRPKK